MIESYSYRRNDDYLRDICRGGVVGASVFRCVGRNQDVDDVREDVWEPGGEYVFPPGGGIQMRIVSTSASDGVGGVGIRTVDIHYLDADGNENIEVVTLNGTTPVNTVATDIWRINDLHAKTAGTSGDAAGQISLTNTAGTITYAFIETSGNRARQAVFTIPAGKKGFINEVWIGGNSEGGSAANFAEGYLRTTTDYSGTEVLPGIFNFKWCAIVASTTAVSEMECPIVVPALCDIKISVVSRAGNSNVRVVAGFAGWIEKE